MSIESAVQRQTNLLSTVGKRVLHTSFPNDFELYVNALELVDSNGKTVKYFIFPVMPSSASEAHTTIENTKKTARGIVNLSTPTFTPVNINLNGDFGRKFKLLLGANFEDLISGFQNLSSVSNNKTTFNTNKLKEPEFDVRVKNGYGCCKLLEKMLLDSKSLTSDGPLTLIYYNLAFGTSYVVRPVDFTFSMSQEKNMIWGYNLVLRAIGDLKDIRTKKQNTLASINNNVVSFIQTKANQMLSSLQTLI